MPVWAPDGKSLAWGSEDGIIVWNAEAGETQSITRGPVVGRVDWSPDGTAIAYYGRETASLVARDAISGEPKFKIPLAVTPANARLPEVVSLGGPSWSPDGSRIAFNCWDGRGDEVCVVDASGGGVNQVTRLEPLRANGAGTEGDQLAGANVGPPEWSPDGRRLAVAAYPERRQAPAGVFVIDLERGQARRVSQRQPNSTIAWEPDGQTLVFSALEKGRSDVFRVSADGANQSNVTADQEGSSQWPALYPSGARLSMVQDGTITVMEEDGSLTSVPELWPGAVGAYPTWNQETGELAFSLSMEVLTNYN